MAHSGPRGESTSSSPRRASCRGLHWPGRWGAGERAASAPFPPPLRPPPPTRRGLSCGFPPLWAARSPESNFFSLRSSSHPPGPRGRGGGRAAAHFPPPEAEAAAGSLGRGERGPGGARGAAEGTIYPSARGPAGPRREAPGAAAETPASSRMSGRRLAPGGPARARLEARAHAHSRVRAQRSPRISVAFPWAPRSRARDSDL